MILPFASRLKRDRSGAVAIISAISMTCLLGCGAFAIDLGSIYMDSRKLQGIADAAALAAASDLTNAQAAADAAIAANPWSRAVTARIELGSYRFDSGIAAGARFVPGATGADAVRVKLTTQAPTYFALALINRKTVTIDRSATASRAKMANFSIGSRLAAVGGGLVGQYLSQLTGSTLNLSVADYQSLIDADVDLLSFSKALGTQIHAEGASFDSVLNTQVTTPQALNALGAALSTSGKTSAASAAVRLAQSITGQNVTLGKLVNLGPYGTESQISSTATVSANSFDLVRGLLQISSPNRQVTLDLAGTIPGLTSVTARIAVGERAQDSPWVTVTDKNDVIVRTAQTRVYVEAGTATNGLLSTSGILSLKLPVMLELASAEAKLADISCGSANASKRVSLDAKPSVGTISVADFDASKFGDFSKPYGGGQATLLKTLLLAVKGSATATLGGASYQRVVFSEADINAHTVKTVSTNDIASSLIVSLLTSLNVTVELLGIGLPLSPLLPGLVKATLQPLAAPLDGLIVSLTDIAGAKLGQADVRVNGVRCGQPALVG